MNGDQSNADFTPSFLDAAGSDSGISVQYTASPLELCMQRSAVALSRPSAHAVGPSNRHSDAEAMQ